MAHYLICYDIANPKRLHKVHRRAVSHALFVQYSVYYLNGDKDQLKLVLDEIQEVINNAEDDVRAYSVTSLSDAILLGKAWLPSEVYLSS
jgi:CRISPR-associated protein Cas2